MSSATMRERVRHLVDSRGFQGFVIGVIIANAVVIGVQTVALPEGVAFALRVFDAVCLAIYCVEAVLKIYAYRADYFKDGWNIFDFAIIVLSLVPDYLLPIPVQVARVLRLFRIARVFRLVSAFRQLRVIVEAIGRSVTGVVWTGLLLLIVIYVFDVAGVSLFGADFPEYFGNLGSGLFTLLQLVTLEGWADVARDIMAVYPLAWMYFAPYIVISSFVMVNVVLGIILGTIEESTQAARIDRAQGEDERLARELAELKAQVETVEYLLEKRHGSR
ncbi:MAG: ion transporter [Eggerthellaceae bacterium]|nr:ion transporter [Eggerthellaceae bacterium]